MTKNLELVSKSDPILRKPCKDSFIVTQNIINGMFRLMREKKGEGLAAPQVGIDAKFFITNWGEIFINPKIESHRHEVFSDEGCLSLPKTIIRVHRWATITLSDGREYGGERAIIIQHEIDHLNGILITDKVYVEKIITNKVYVEGEKSE